MKSFIFSPILLLSTLGSKNWTRDPWKKCFYGLWLRTDKSHVLKTGCHAFIILSRFFFNDAVFSRKCYACLSTHSWKDCEDNQYKGTCLDSSDCISASSNSSHDKVYVKGCAATCSASEIPECEDPGIYCQLDCCSSDYCNSSSGGMVSGLLLTACVASGFIHLFSY